MKTPVSSTNAPRAIGPYSQAVAVSGSEMVFCSGQVGLDPTTQKLVEGVSAQARCALANLRAVLGAAGLTMEHVVRTTIYLTDMGDYATVNEAYSEVFSTGVRPARAAVGVSALPAGALVEIDAIAVR